MIIVCIIALFFFIPEALCNDELGVKYNSKVSGTQLSASGVRDNNDRTFGAPSGRLNTRFGDVADGWSLAVNDKNQWLQVK